MKDNYPNGIDEAERCLSTKLEPMVIPPPPTAAEQKEGKEDPYSMYDRTDPNGPWNRYLAVKTDEKLAYQKHLGFKARNFPPGEILAARRKENALRKHRELMALKHPEVPVVAKKKIGYNVVAGKKSEPKKKRHYNSSSESENEDDVDEEAKEVVNSRPSTQQSRNDAVTGQGVVSPVPSRPITPSNKQKQLPLTQQNLHANQHNKTTPIPSTIQSKTALVGKKHVTIKSR